MDNENTNSTTNNNKKQKKQNFIMIRISEEDKIKLKEKCNRDDKTLSKVILNKIKEYINS